MNGETNQQTNTVRTNGMTPPRIVITGMGALTPLGHTVEETWRTCQEGRFKLRSFGIKPAMLTTAGVGLVWTIPSYSTTVCVSLRRDPNEVTQVRGLARFDTHNRARIHLRGESSTPPACIILRSCIPAAKNWRV